MRRLKAGTLVADRFNNASAIPNASLRDDCCRLYFVRDYAVFSGIVWQLR